MKNKFKIISLIFVMTCMNNISAAQTTSGNFEAGATLNSSCAVSVTNMDFSTINPLINNTVTGTLTLLCNGGFTNIQLSSGNSNDFNMREMNGQTNGDKLKYNIYTDTEYTKIIGDGTSGTSRPLSGLYAGRTFINGVARGRDIYTDTGIASRGIALYFFGKVDAGQYVKPDTYTDNITVTITY